MENKKDRPLTLTQRIQQELYEEQNLQQTQQISNSIEPQKIILHQEQNFGEQGFFQQYVDVGLTQTVYFFQSIFGSNYSKQNNQIGFDSKQKILRYIFSVNDLLQDKIIKYNRDKLKQNTSIKQKIMDNQNLKLINRVSLVYMLSDSRNRIGIMGYSWGAFLASLFHITIFKNISYWRRLALWVTIFHSSGLYFYKSFSINKGQIINYLNIDRFFDKIYGMYKEDLKVYEKDQKIKQQNGETELGKLQQNNMDNLLAKVRVDLFYDYDIKDNQK